MANIDEQRAGRSALRAAQKSSADSTDPTVGWTAQQGAMPTTVRTSGVMADNPDVTPGAPTAGAPVNKIAAQERRAKEAAARGKDDSGDDARREQLEAGAVELEQLNRRDDLNEMTIPELREHAEDEEIDLGGVTLKDDIIDAIVAAEEAEDEDEYLEGDGDDEE